MNRKLFLHKIGKGINLFILCALILINLVPVGIQPVFAQSANPSFSARLTENQVHGYDWPLGASVTLTIDGNVVGSKTVVVADWDPNQTFVWFDASLQLDQVIEMTDGVVTKAHTVTSLVVTGVDPDNDTVSGTADPGTQVDIGHIYCDENGCYGFRRETADVNGDWVADFSVPGEDDDEQDIIDIQPGMGSEARQCDIDGDCTQYGWYVPNPAFGVRANEDRIEGWEWTLGSTLTIVIDDPTTSDDPDPIYTTVGVADWDPNQTWFNVNIENYDLKTGDIVTVTDGNVTKTHTVTSLSFTDVNIDEDIVTGVAASGSHVDIWACPDNGDCINRHVDADTDGTWVADFGQFGDENDEQNTFNIVPGTWIDSSQSDNDGDQTYWGLNVPDPRIEVSYEHDWIQIRDFTAGGEVTYTIYDYEGGHALFGPVTGPVDSHGDGWIAYNLHHTDLIPGNYITAVNEATGEEVSILVRDLNLDYVGVDDDIAFGTAEPNTTIEIHISETHDDWFSLTTDVDSAGNWDIDLAAEGHPIDSYRHAGIYLYDAEGDNIFAQPPRIHAHVRSDNFNVDNFSKNADVTLTLYDSSGGNVLYGPVTLRTNSSGNAWVNLWPYGIDLVPGNYIVAYDHALDFTKSLEIEPFTIDGMNTAEDYVYGTSAVGEWVDLHVESLFSNWGLDALTDENGAWFRDYGAEDYDITDQMWTNGWATDDEDNWSEDYTTGLPNIEASIADDWISGFNFSPDRQVRISFYDAEGGTLIKTFVVTAWGDTQFHTNYWDHGVDLQAGMYLHAEDIETGKYSELTLVPLTFDGIDYDVDTAWGRADSGTQVVVRANQLFESHEITVIADGAGNWFADFSSEGADLTTDWDLRALVFDLEYDATVADAPRPPELTASVDGDWVSGENWTPNQSVSISVYESEGGSPVGSTITWNTDNYGSFYTELGNEGIDLLPGYHIVVEDNYSGVIKTITLPNLTIDYIDPVQDVAGGQAPADTRLSVDFSNQQESIQFDLFSESDGTWEADFAAHDFDLQPGSQGNVRLTDEDGDATQVDGYVPNPTFGVRANEERVEGWEWPDGVTVTISIDDPVTSENPDFTGTAIVGIADWDPNQTWFNLDIQGEYDLKPDDVVTVTDGTTTKQTIITNLVITQIDTETDIVYGVAPPLSQINVWTCDNNYCADREETVDSSGNWSVDFSVPGNQNWEQEIFDIQIGSWVDSAIWDGDGDGTMSGKAVTGPPRIDVSHTYDQVEATGFTPNSDVSIVIFDSPGGTSLFGPLTQTTSSEGSITFAADVLGCNTLLNAGYEVVVTDIATGHQRSIVIRDIFIDTFDLGSDTVEGTATPNAMVLVTVADRWNSHEIEVVADEFGNWSADFGSAGFDTFDGMIATAQILDEDEDFVSVVANPGHSSNDIFAVAYRNNVTFCEGKEFTLRAGWGAGSAELVQDYIELNDSIFTLTGPDGYSLIITTPDVNEYWGEPVDVGFVSPDMLPEYTSTWYAYWRYLVGSLSPGVYNLDSLLHVSQPIIDGGDYDGDGQADVFEGEIFSASIQITVVPANQAPVADANGIYLIAVGQPLILDGSGSSDPDGDHLVYDWDWGDTTNSPDAGATPTHVYSDAGIYDICLTVTDPGGASDTSCTYAVVYDPSGGFVTGGGWIDSPAGAYTAYPSLTGKATFAFVSRYKKGASVPTGNTGFQFSAADLDFKSDSYDWLVVTGSDYARFKGTGTIKGELDPNGNAFKFLLWAGDNDPDTFRIKIWYEDGGSEVVVYDNGMDQEIGGGSIVVHSK